MKTIIFVSPHNDLYGAEKSMIAIASFMYENGYFPVIILRAKGKICDELDKRNLEYVVWDYEVCINTAGKTNFKLGLIYSSKNIPGSKKLAQILKSKWRNILCVYTNSIVTDFGVLLAKRLGVKHIQHIREFGLLDFNMEFNFGKKWAQRTFNYSEKIVCVSDAVYEHYSQLFPDKKMIRIYNGLPLYTRRPKIEKDNNIIKILVIGRLSSEKNQDEIIKGCDILYKKYNIDFQLDLYGSGVNKSYLYELVRNLELNDKVNFMNYHDVIPFENYDLAVIASRAEAFGRVTVEYMMNYLPVIGACTGATKEIILDGKTGLLYEPGNYMELADKLYFLISKPNLCHQMGENGYQRASKCFSEEQYCNNMLELFSTMD